jgi:hypothetical protein
MTTPQFIEWLDAKMTTHGVGKLIPPGEVLVEELEKRIEDKVRKMLIERILEEAGLEDQIAEAIEAIKLPSGVTLAKGIKASFKQKQPPSGFSPPTVESRAVWCSISALSSAPSSTHGRGNPQPHHQADGGAERAVGGVVVGEVGEEPNIVPPRLRRRRGVRP